MSFIANAESDTNDYKFNQYGSVQLHNEPQDEEKNYDEDDRKNSDKSKVLAIANVAHNSVQNVDYS